ncbi:MAG: NAD(P)H-dependent oxidoreductase [Pseudomonadota bacterium]
MSDVLNVLRVDGSMRREGSVTRSLTDDVISRLSEGSNVKVQTRDLLDGVDLIDERWLGANWTPADQRSEDAKMALAASDALVKEVKAADILVLGAPIYNFSVPAAVKAWIDQIARAGETFRYTENGPVGLLEGKRAIVVLASGGTQVGSEIDFASDYLKHIMGFIGITDVQMVYADKLMAQADEAQAQAQSQIKQLAA